MNRNASWTTFAIMLLAFAFFGLAAIAYPNMEWRIIMVLTTVSILLLPPFLGLGAEFGYGFSCGGWLYLVITYLIAPAVGRSFATTLILDQAYSSIHGDGYERLSDFIIIGHSVCAILFAVLGGILGMSLRRDARKALWKRLS